MDLTKVRTDNLASDETYSMIMGSYEFVHNQRALKRDLCFTRIAFAFFLVVCMAVCTVVYVQQNTGLKNEEDHAKTKGTLPVAKALSDVQPAGMPEPLFASLRLAECDYFLKPVLGNIKWKPEELQGFSLDQDNETLVVSQSGLYTITLQITYRETEDKKGQVDINHKLIRYTDAYNDPINILTVYETVCKEKNWFQSLFSQKVIHLEKGDRLKVETNNLKLVHCEGTSATFLRAQLNGLLSV